MNGSGRLYFVRVFGGDWFGIVSLALMMGKYCRIEFEVFNCLFVLFLLIFVFLNLSCSGHVDGLFLLSFLLLFLLLLSFALYIKCILHCILGAHVYFF